MALIPLRKDNGKPDEGGLYTSAMLLSALYFGKKEVLDLYAEQTNTTLAAYDPNPNSPTPQYAVFVGANEALVVLDGTTNLMQWLAHTGSMICPGPDPNVRLASIGVAVCNRYWLEYSDSVRFLTRELLAGQIPMRIQFIGHSYGAACCHMFARAMADYDTPPNWIDILTFGEPRSYDGRPALHEPDWHARIVSSALVTNFDDRLAVDPVTLVPPAMWQIARIPIVGKIFKGIFNLAWKHFGDAYILTSESLNEPPDWLDYTSLIPGQEYARLLISVSATDRHFMNKTYLPWSRNIAVQSFRFGLHPPADIPKQSVKRAGPGVDLKAFDPYFTEFTHLTFTPPANRGPRLDTASINTFYGLVGPEVITNENYTEFGSISALATIVDSNSTVGLTLGAGPIGMIGEAEGIGGARPFWLFRGVDRDMIEKALLVLRGIVRRDNKKANNADKIISPEDAENYGALHQMISWLEYQSLIARQPGVDVG